ncbi:hypothetical protein [Bacillus taeanensis]|uniref:Uncharacterized protein n=1 Tax=Bacillus taeanensis TaxID=273032 RepID=A0A366XTH1_9BACI|nr:hypothetical protein [Bacillus taeanensis]RBW69197.1 hypothetical protein DS031_12500 [Bacillus taeanensis]
MFDPTIYENLKVVMEGAIYDLDLTNEIKVRNRSDILNLAVMSRCFSMQFQSYKAKDSYPLAEIALHTSMKDLALEILEENETEAGCEIAVYFYTRIKNIEKDCSHIEFFLNNIWNQRPAIKQEISYYYSNKNTVYNKVTLTFGRKINEDQIDDFHNIIDHTLQSLYYFETELS